MMGTNYYLRTDPCPHCGRSDEELHIGKSSAGWCFSLHVMPEDGIDGLEAWEQRWKTGRIFNEYREEVAPEEMRRIITERSWPERPREESFYRQNHAVPGPNGMVRHAVGRHCLGHGEGTWDLITGEFS